MNNPNNSIHGTYIRNGSGFTFQILLSEDPTMIHLKPFDHEGGIKTLPLSIYKQLQKNGNYVSVTNPNSSIERIIGKQIGSERFLIRN
jgi:hypothetical protein